MKDKLIVETKITFRGKELGMNVVISSIDIEKIMPTTGPIDRFTTQDDLNRDERRRSYVDLISSQIANAIIQALFVTANER